MPKIWLFLLFFDEMPRNAKQVFPLTRKGCVHGGREIFSKILFFDEMARNTHKKFPPGKE